MMYLSGVHALNIEDSLETCGDWHTSALNWGTIKLHDSTKTVFGDWGIEADKKIPEHEELYNVANTLRAILDLMVDKQTRYLKGFRDDFIMVDTYNTEFFEKVYLLKDLQNWQDINNLMKREYMFLWDKFMEGKSYG